MSASMKSPQKSRFSRSLRKPKKERINATTQPIQEQPRPDGETAAVTQMASAASNPQDEQIAARALAARRIKLWSAYQVEIHAAVERAKTRPYTGRVADVLVSVTIAPSGQLLSCSVAKSAGVPELDQAAMTSVERAAPFPPIPREVSAAPLTLTVPFEYRVVQR